MMWKMMCIIHFNNPVLICTKKKSNKSGNKALLCLKKPQEQDNKLVIVFEEHALSPTLKANKHKFGSSSAWYYYYW